MQEFRRSLYIEHLEELSWLCQMREGLLPHEVEHRDALDRRIEAHLDALVVGGELAIAVCIERATEGDGGELHAATRVFCRSERPELVERAAQSVPPGDQARASALGSALQYEMPATWARRAEAWIAGPSPLREAAAEALASRKQASFPVGQTRLLGRTG